jgi:hypothetical protein
MTRRKHRAVGETRLLLAANLGKKGRVPWVQAALGAPRIETYNSPLVSR